MSESGDWSAHQLPNDPKEPTPDEAQQPQSDQITIPDMERGIDIDDSEDDETVKQTSQNPKGQPKSSFGRNEP